MNFLVDEQLPPALARWLREAGHEASHVEDVGLRGASDSAIWKHALQSGAAIITKDADFAARSVLVAASPVIVWLLIGNSTNQRLFQWLEVRLPSILQWIARGERLIEVI